MNWRRNGSSEQPREARFAGPPGPEDCDIQRRTLAGNQIGEFVCQGSEVESVIRTPIQRPVVNVAID
jgi:hypothetical protein